MSQLTGRKGVLLGGIAAATVALGIGGVAYAVGDDPAPQQGYVTVEDAPSTTPAPGATSENSQGYDCPEKDGTGGTQGQAQGDGTPESSDPQGQA